MGNEPARVPAPLGKRLGGRPLGFEFSVLRSMDGEAAEAAAPVRTRVGPQGLGRETSAIRSGCAIRLADGTRPEPGRASRPCRFDSCRILWLVAHRV